MQSPKERTCLTHLEKNNSEKGKPSSREGGKEENAADGGTPSTCGKALREGVIHKSIIVQDGSCPENMWRVRAGGSGLQS